MTTRLKRLFRLRNRMCLVFASVGCLWFAGCDSVRLAPSETQKQNAWLHHRTATVAAETAQTEDASETLMSLAKLSALQSQALSSYCGQPEECPQAETAEQILDQANWTLAETALAQSVERADPWAVADSVLEIGIGISALLGGVYGTRALTFFKDAQAKSQALKEIIEGNEVFKKDNAEQAQAFKTAQANQSTQTRQIVAAMKG